MNLESHYTNGFYRFLYFDEIEEYEALILELNSFLKTNEHNIYALNNRAVANCEIGNAEEAKVDLEKVLDMGVQDYVPFHNLGGIYQNEGNLEDALNLYSKAIKLYPNEVSCYRARAGALLNAKMWAEAIPDLDSSISMEPNVKQTYLDRAQAKEQSGDLTGGKADRVLASKL